jgi:hypothetical protein
MDPITAAAEVAVEQPADTAPDTNEYNFERDFLSGFDSDLDGDVSSDVTAEPTNEEVIAEGETPGTVTTPSTETVVAPNTTQPAPAPVVPAQQPVPPVTPAAVVQPQQQLTPVAEAQRQLPLHDLIARDRDVLTNQLATSPAFQLPSAEADLFDDPRVAQFIATNNARTFLQTMSAVSQLIHTTLPQTVREVSAVTSQAAAYENEFFTDHPDLRAPEHEPLLKNLLVALRQSNPNLDRKGLQTMLATTARATLNLPAPSSAPVSTAPIPAVRSSAPAGTKQISRSVAFVPAANASTGAGSSQRNKSGQLSEIDSLIGMFNAPDLD